MTFNSQFTAFSILMRHILGEFSFMAVMDDKDTFDFNSLYKSAIKFFLPMTDQNGVICDSEALMIALEAFLMDYECVFDVLAIRQNIVVAINNYHKE